jgi:mono/diheme cytochrome c family protein
MKPCTSTSKCFAALLAVVTLTLSTWVAWDNWGRFLQTSATSAVPTTTSEKTETIANGKYLAHIGGCVACHTSKGGEPLAGGRRIDTPFGAVFTSNLTSSSTHGLGTWTATDFENALHWGRSRDGRLLLPVFPYNHTSVFSPKDVHAIFAWLQTVKPVEQAQTPHRLTWPLGTQPVIAVWRSLFFTPTPFKENVTESAEWNRGAYLVQSAGHCAACHGQRNSLGSFPAVDDLSGGFLSPQMWVAPSLVDNKQTTIATSNTEEIAKLLRVGHSRSAHASGPMAEFVQQTGQYLSASDAHAIAVYLKARIKPTEPGSTTQGIVRASTNADATALYKTHCASCHGEHGEGKAGMYPALAGNPAVVLAQPDNLIQMALYGGYGPSTAENPRPWGMPPFLFTLNNQQIADVLNHIRSQWGNQATAVRPIQVDRVRGAAAY